MAKTSTNISIDADIKIKAQELFADLGLDLSTAINMFLRQAVRDNAFPFNVTRKVPNSETIEAINEFEEFKNNPRAYKRYSSFSELLDEVRDNA